MSILEKIWENGIVSKEIVNQTLQREGTQAGALEALLQQKLINQRQLAELRAKLAQLPFRQLPKDFAIPEEFFSLFPRKLIVQLKVIPIKRVRDEVEVGVVEPENLEVDSVLDFIAVSHNLTIKRFVISPDDYEEVVKKLKPLETEVAQALEKLGAEREVKEGIEKRIISQVELQRLAEQAPVTQIVDVILRYGVDAGASDIHIEPLQSQTRVRFRIDGRLKASLFLPKQILPAVIARIKILANLRVDEMRIPQDGRIHFRFESRMVDFRISIFPTIEGEKAAIRILDPTKGITSLEALGLQLKSLADIEAFIEKPFGAMLISGPTGSGKSTTLYTILRDLNRENVNIVTLEDPVEYYLSGVNQSQVHPEINYDFASGLREIVRQDPNIIMVGEVRDSQTASLLIHAALTGHLVFSTIHTNNVLGIIPRLLNMGVENFLIPAALQVVVSQRLIAKLCPSCKVAYQPSGQIAAIMKRELEFLPRSLLDELGIFEETLQPPRLFKSVGCDECGQTGITGRIGVFETMTVGQELEEIIMTEPTESNLKKEAMRQGMVTMRQDGIIKALKGIMGIEGLLINTESSYV